MTGLGVGALVRAYRALHAQDALARDVVYGFRVVGRAGRVPGRGRMPEWAPPDVDVEAPLRRASERLALLRALKIALPHDLRDRTWMMLHVDGGP